MPGRIFLFYPTFSKGLLAHEEQMSTINLRKKFFLAGGILAAVFVIPTTSAFGITA